MNSNQYNFEQMYGYYSQYINEKSFWFCKFCSSQVMNAIFVLRLEHINDPSAGSPTETLLRLLLPLNNQVRSTFAKHP